MRTLLIALAVVTLFGCKKPAPDAPPPTPAFDERQGCSADADCAAVEIGCCDHCNDGTVVGVHRDYAADVHTEYTSACGNVGCTKRRCSKGHCGVSVDGHEALPDLPAH